MEIFNVCHLTGDDPAICMTLLPLNWGHAVAQLVEALRYKPEGRWFDSRWCHWHV